MRLPLVLILFLPVFHATEPSRRLDPLRENEND